ncbi:hypothetical protein [Streptosporangium vulgare]|uniref:hypothetical protein n=1 Tax=Streptosporangium vulgare TaxID=46190 RepID=UPI0031E456C4
MIKDGTWTWEKVAAQNAAVASKTGKAGMVVRELRLQGLGQPRHGVGRLGRPGVERGRQDLRVRQSRDGSRP